MQLWSKSVPELGSVYLKEKCHCCVAGVLDKTRSEQEESTHVSEELSMVSKYFYKQSFQGGKDLIFPSCEKYPEIKPSESQYFESQITFRAHKINF